MMAGEQAGEQQKELKKYSWEEVAQHNTADSLWVVIHGEVYDITEFLKEVDQGIVNSL